jgi:glycosyltransferase involved in cell wall biosynthesis
VNADQTPILARGFGEKFFRDRYTVGVWAWELEEFPDVFMEAFDYVQEVWTPSWFIHQAVAEKSPVPVVHMPFAVTVAPSVGLARRDFGVPEDRFLFLMLYDALSVQERKNPSGALEAFRRAFGNQPNVGLVIRVNHANSKPDEMASIRRQIADTDGALLIEEPMSRQDVQALQTLCDAFISLHRSEGLGLNIAEAMLLGKPVVVTGWSGNLDFTTDRNAYLVDYKLTTLSRDHGPYRRGKQWAEPDIDRAAELMVKLVEDAGYRQAVAIRGQETIANEFSPRAVGIRYQRRLATIQRLTRRTS